LTILLTNYFKINKIQEVYRKSTGVRLISTREYAESYVFADRYQQLFFRLASENVFGFGENTHESFRHTFNSDSLTYSVFARDEPPSGNSTKYMLLQYRRFKTRKSRTFVF
jgi:hypothetical protein